MCLKFGYWVQQSKKRKGRHPWSIQFALGLGYIGKDLMRCSNSILLFSN
jgi:hypothetical protein